MPWIRCPSGQNAWRRDSRPQFSAANNEALQQATPGAITALTQYRAWLTSKLPTARKDTAIGRDNYIFFLRNVALLPYTPEQLLAMSQQEWSRAVAFEAYQQARLAGAPPRTPLSQCRGPDTSRKGG